MKKLLLTATAIVAFSSSAFADGTSATDEALATATVVEAIGIEVTQHPNFGSFDAGTNGGSITTAGVVDGDVTKVPGSQDDFRTLTVKVTGTKGMYYGITANGSGVIGPNNMPSVTLSNGKATMTANMTSYTVNGQAMNVAQTPLSAGGTNGGEDVLDVSGTLIVGAEQAPGDYKGTMDLVVTYN